MPQNAELEVSELDEFPFPLPFIVVVPPIEFPVFGGFGVAQRMANLIDRVGMIVIVRRPSTDEEVQVRAKEVDLTASGEIADGIIGRNRRFVMSALRLEGAGFPVPLRARDQIIDPHDRLYTITAVQLQRRNETDLQYWVTVAGNA
jgi:hypothetical protein